MFNKKLVFLESFVRDFSELDCFSLQDFQHEGLVGVERIWNLSSLPKVQEFVGAVTDEKRRALSVEVIENFKKVVIPEYDQLLFGAIHGDLNEQNILGNFHY